MDNNHYKASDPDPVVQDYNKPGRSKLLVTSSLLLIAIATCCFLAWYTVSDAGEDIELSLEKIDELSHRIETQEITLKRESLLEYFKLNREQMVEDAETQETASAYFFFLGILILAIAIYQLMLLKGVIKESAK